MQNYRHNSEVRSAHLVAKFSLTMPHEKSPQTPSSASCRVVPSAVKQKTSLWMEAQTLGNRFGDAIDCRHNTMNTVVCRSTTRTATSIFASSQVRANGKGQEDISCGELCSLKVIIVGLGFGIAQPWIVNPALHCKDLIAQEKF